MATQVNDSNFDAVVLQSQLPVLLAEYTFRTRNSNPRILIYCYFLFNLFFLFDSAKN